MFADFSGIESKPHFNCVE